MRTRRGCGLVTLGGLFIVVACLIFVALAAALVRTGEVSFYAPRLTAFEPHPNDAFQPTTPITLTFDQPMDPASVEAAFRLEPDVPGTFRWSEDYHQVTFLPGGAGYAPGATYHAQLAAGARGGTPPRGTRRAVAWNFSLAPLVASLQPPPGEVELGARPLLEAVFHYALDCATTSETLAIRPDAAGLLECEGYRLAFSPTLPLLPDTAYVATLENVYLAGDPTARPGVRWEFRTAPALSVQEVDPAAAEPLGDLWVPFHITFNRPVVADSAVSRFSLLSADGTPLAGTVAWEEDGASLVFQPTEALVPDSQYQLGLERGVRDGLGFELDEAMRLRYETQPMLGQPLPAPGTEGVALDSRIEVPFTRPMDRAGVEAGLAIAPATDGQVTWEEDTLVFAPRGSLAPETSYRVTLDAAVRDASGAPLARTHEWTFATEPFLLEAQMPGRQPLTELQQTIGFTFALPMNRASVQAALTISPTTEGELVWSDDDRTVVFQPEPGWLAGTEYGVSLSASARTADGSQSLGEDRTYHYATSVAEVGFGVGSNVQIMDAGGGRTVQVISRGADMADLSLYAITPEQFLDLYSSGFRGIGPEEPRILDTRALTPTVEWRGLLTPLEGERYGGWGTAEVRLPADVPPGLYILSSEPPVEEQGPLLLVLSHHALMLKEALAGTGSRARAQVIAWDTEIEGGAPVVSATVRLYDRDGTVLAEGVTDDAGLLAMEVPGDPGPLMALAEREGDVSVCGLGHEWSQTGWWGWWLPLPSQLHYLTYSYTDRPIYRPAQTVYFKDLVRAEDDVSYTLPPPDLPVTVRLRDARDNVAASQVFTPTYFGTVHGEFTLADETMLGTWNLETEADGEVVRQPFQVEEYRKPEYEVSVGTPLKTYVLGEPISVTVEANYYFGEPVANAEVVLLAFPVHAEDLYQENELLFGAPVPSQEGRTDAQGRWTAVLSSEEVFGGGEKAQRTDVALEATVTDEVGQGVSSYQTVVVQRAAQDLTVVQDRTGYRPNEEILLAALVRDRDGGPAAGVELHAQVLGWDGAEVASATARTDGAGRAELKVQVAEQGWYELRVSGSDEGGRPIEAEGTLWVYDPEGLAPWYTGRSDEAPGLTVAADRRSYRAGEDAQLAIYTPVAGPALLTFERGRTHDAEPIHLISGTNLISVPVRAEYGPNIHVTVSQFGPPDPGWWGGQNQPESQLYVASSQLLVPMSQQLLSITLTADQEIYGPGDEATFQVRVTDQEGQPVVAELSLAVVDEAIYALSEDLSRDPFEVFYGPRPNLVRTFDSLRPSRWLYPEEPGMGGAGAEAGGAPRRTFLDTAYWAPATITDQNGEATLTFALPENLTQWRALARAVTTDTLVGQATARVTVSQEIMLRPALPRFLTQGDAMTLTAVVHNFTAQPVSATVGLELEGLTLGGDAEQVRNVPAGGSAKAAWPVTADQAGGAQVTLWTTATRGTRLVGRDAVEASLPVYPLAVQEISTWAGELTRIRPTETLTIDLSSDVLTSTGGLEIDLAPSLASGLLPGLEYLIGYPYGCVEQTMSRVLPNAMVARAFRQLGLQNEMLEVDLPPMVDQGLDRLYGFQHNDGGWGWWYDDSTDVNQTAYVLFGLAMTEEAGFDIDGGVMERGAEALHRLMVEVDPRAQAYAAFALATARQPVSLTLTVTDVLDLDLFSQAALAMALDAAGETASVPEGTRGMVDALLDSLREAAIQEDEMVRWEETGEHTAYNRAVMGSTVRTTAMVADALVRLDAQSPLLPGAVRWLMAERQGRGWGNTQESSYALLTLADYVLATQEAARGTAWRVHLNGELWQEGVLEPAAEGQVVSLPVAAFMPGENSVELMLGAEGEVPAGRLYYGATLSVYGARDETGIPARRSHERSIGIRREYRLLEGDGGERPGAFREGDLVEVRITLDVPAESWYVVIDDPLPAGFEALNERLGTTSHVATAYAGPVTYWEDYGYNRKDVRDERVVLFVTRLAAGQQDFSYLARATVAGSFTALPTQVYPMYEPEVWSRSDSAAYQIEMH